MNIEPLFTKYQNFKKINLEKIWKKNNKIIFEEPPADPWEAEQLKIDRKNHFDFNQYQSDEEVIFTPSIMETHYQNQNTFIINLDDGDEKLPIFVYKWKGNNQKTITYLITDDELKKREAIINDKIDKLQETLLSYINIKS